MLKFLAVFLFLLLLAFIGYLLLNPIPLTIPPSPQVLIITLTSEPPTFTSTFTDTPTSTRSSGATDNGMAITAFTSTHTRLATKLSSTTPFPSKGFVHAEVLERANCRYGPGSAYLYKYGLVPGSNMNVIGRIESGTWVYIQAVGGSNPCWVNSSLVKITGDLDSVDIAYPGKALLPVSPYYPPVSWVAAVRDDALVTVSWNDVPLRTGDEEDEDMQHYIVEVWRCEGGQLFFEPIGTNDLLLSFIDQYGCNLPSHGRVYVQEKHGFAGPVDIPWP